MSRCCVVALLLLANQAAADIVPVTNVVLAGAYGNLVRHMRFLFAHKRTLTLTAQIITTIT